MKKILFLVTITASIFIIKDLVSSIYTLWSKSDLLVVAGRQLVAEKRKHVVLQSQLSHVQQPDFIESQVRNKLFLAKPGETVVLLGQKPPFETKSKPTVKLTNWQQWWNLFFPSATEE